MQRCEDALLRRIAAQRWEEKHLAGKVEGMRSKAQQIADQMIP